MGKDHHRVGSRKLSILSFPLRLLLPRRCHIVPVMMLIPIIKPMIEPFYLAA